MTGTEIINQGVEMLRRVGGRVQVFNSRFKQYGGGRNFVDVLWIFRDTTFYIEVKAKGDRMRPGQAEFAESIADHCGPHVRYRVITTVDGFERIAQEGADVI